MNKSLGLVEVQGLALAIQTVDAMSKSANVEILGLESTNGSGWTLIKVAGDVGSINAAVEVGRDLAMKNNGLVSCKVIARSGLGLEQFIAEKPAEPAAAKPAPQKASPAAKKAATKKAPAKKGDKA